MTMSARRLLISAMKEVLLQFKEPTIYLIFAFVTLVLSSGTKYVNINGILSDYFRKFIFDDLKTLPIMFLFPMFLAIATTMIKTIDSNLLEIITVAISILMSLFFTYLSFFQNIQDDNNQKPGNINIKKQVNDYAEETKAVASYEIFISILTLILCFIHPIYSSKIMDGLIYFLFYHLLINLLVLLKRYNNNLSS